MGTPSVDTSAGFGQRKATLATACDNLGITSTDRRNQILAAFECEGDMSASVNDTSKSGASANYGASNLNSGMIADLGLTAVEPDLRSSDALTADKASAQVINAAIDKYGLEGFEQWTRGGQTLHNNPTDPTVAANAKWSEYQTGFADTLAKISSSPTAWTDDNRFNPNISYLG